MLEAIDILRIHQLLARYGRALDEHDWEALERLFTDNASIDYRGASGRTERQGRDEVVAWFRDLAESHPPAHHVTNIIIDEESPADGPVEVVSKFLAPYTRPNHSPKRLYGGDYRDIVVRTSDGWRFSFKSCDPKWNLAVVVDTDVPDHRVTF